MRILRMLKIQFYDVVNPAVRPDPGHISSIHLYVYINRILIQCTDCIYVNVATVFLTPNQRSKTATNDYWILCLGFRELRNHYSTITR